MKKINILSILILIGFVVVGAIFLKGHTSELKKILEINLMYTIPIFILVILISLFNAYKLIDLLKVYGIKLELKEAWGLQMTALFWNSLIPFQGGLPARAVYLKKKYGLPYTSSASIIGIAYLTDFLIFGLLGIIFSIFIPVPNEIKYSLLIFFGMILLGSGSVLFFLPSNIKTDVKVLKYIIRSVQELRRIRTEYSLLFKLSLNCICRLSMGALKFYFLFYAFNAVLPFYSGMIINLFQAVALVISITPMDLGFRESVVVAGSKLLGIGALLGTFVAVLDRAITMLWVFISAPIFSYILSKNFKIQKAYKPIIPKL